MKYTIASVLSLTLCSAFAADFELADSTGKQDFHWSNKDVWILKSGSSDLGYPGKNDSVSILPYTANSNAALTLNSAKGRNDSEIQIKDISVDLYSSLTFYSQLPIQRFIVDGDFVKKSKTILNKDGAPSAEMFGQGHLAIAPANKGQFLNVKILGSLSASDKAINRTSNLAFGGNDYFGSFRGADVLLDSFYVEKDVSLENHLLFIGTKRGKNAQINGIVNFSEPVNGRQGVLILNGDLGADASHLHQVLKVGGLNSVSEGTGIISTRTGMRKFVAIDPLSKEGENATSKELMQKKAEGDETIREGTIEITGKGGVFSGSIQDNYRNDDKRGRVNIIMNSAGATQTLSGDNSFTGSTSIRSGTLVMNLNNYFGEINLQGGQFVIMSDLPSMNILNWSSGGFVFDLSKHQPITIKQDVSVSTMPEASDTLVFSNISPRSYTLFNFKNKKDVFSSFIGKRIEYKDAATGKIYDGVFGASDSALSIVFIEKK